jgi:Tfp pilus assembly protein PilO
MTSYLDKLNLRPQERRLVVIVASVVFVVLNLWMVFPHFGDWGKLQQRTVDARRTRARYQEEMKKEAEYKREVDRLQSMGDYIASDQQALELMGEVRTRAAATGLNVQRWDPKSTAGTARTNSFFDETTLTISFVAEEKALVDFLWELSGQGSLTRVRTMNLRRDPTQMRLAGDITLVKSFQRKPGAKTLGTTVAAAAAAIKAPKTTNALARLAAANRPATNPPAKAAPAKAAPAGKAAPAKAAPAGKAAPAKAAPAKGGGAATNKAAQAAPAKDSGSGTNAPGFFKKVFSKWF